MLRSDVRGQKCCFDMLCLAVGLLDAMFTAGFLQTVPGIHGNSRSGLRGAGRELMHFSPELCSVLVCRCVPSRDSLVQAVDNAMDSDDEADALVASVWK